MILNYDLELTTEVLLEVWFGGRFVHLETVLDKTGSTKYLQRQGHTAIKTGSHGNQDWSQTAIKPQSSNHGHMAIKSWSHGNQDSET